MMRKYFPLEASERLFVAIEEDDVVDAQVSLPPKPAANHRHQVRPESGRPVR